MWPHNCRLSPSSATPANAPELLHRAPRETLRLRQSTGTVYLHLPSARTDEWDGNTVDGYRIPAMEVLRACLQACVGALGTMTDAAIAAAEEQRTQPKL